MQLEVTSRNPEVFLFAKLKGTAYVGNNPLNYTDPSGLGFWSSFLGFLEQVSVGWILNSFGIGGSGLPSIGSITGCGGPLGNCGTLGGGPWSEQSPVGLSVQDPGRFIMSFADQGQVDGLPSSDWLSWIPSIRAKGQSFKACMEQHANLYSIGGSVELAANVISGTNTSYSSKPLVSFFTGNAINGLLFGSGLDNAGSAVNNTPAIIGRAMGGATTYGRRTTDIMALNLSGKGGVPIALGQGASKAGGISASAR